MWVGMRGCEEWLKDVGSGGSWQGLWGVAGDFRRCQGLLGAMGSEGGCQGGVESDRGDIPGCAGLGA